MVLYRVVGHNRNKLLEKGLVMQASIGKPTNWWSLDANLTTFARNAAKSTNSTYFFCNLVDAINFKVHSGVDGYHIYKYEVPDDMIDASDYGLGAYIVGGNGLKYFLRDNLAEKGINGTLLCASIPVIEVLLPNDALAAAKVSKIDESDVKTGCLQIYNEGPKPPYSQKLVKAFKTFGFDIGQLASDECLSIVSEKLSQAQIGKTVLGCIKGLNRKVENEKAACQSQSLLS